MPRPSGLNMLTRKQYKQRWLFFKRKNPKMSQTLLWEFQKSILSPEEHKASNCFNLHLKNSDPRKEVMDITDKLWHKVPYRNGL